MCFCRLEDSKAERIAKYQGMNLYIKNISDEMTDDEVREMFTAAGTITSCKVRTSGAVFFPAACRHQYLHLRPAVISFHQVLQQHYSWILQHTVRTSY